MKIALMIILSTLATILLGFWSISKIWKSIEILFSNLRGGEDVTKLVEENKYGEFATYIFKNLFPSTTKKVGLKEVSILITLQEKYIKQNDDVFTENNTYYIKNELNRKGIRGVNEKEIKDFFDVLKNYFST